MELYSSEVFKIKPEINAFRPYQQERRQRGQCCLGLTVLPWGCSPIPEADPYFRCQAGDELWTTQSIFTCSCCDSPGLTCSGVHISPVTTGFGSDSKAGRDEQGQQVSQLWSAPRQNNTCLDISYAWRAIHLSSVSHMHSFTLSKYDLTLANTQRIYTHIIYPPFHKHCDTEDLFLTGNATISTCGLELHCDCF